MRVKNTNNDLIGIGSALLDFTVEVNDNDLQKLGLTKGGMLLIDENRSREILNLISKYKVKTTPGGSSANTLAGIANFNGTGIFMGKVGSDSHGDIYINETEKTGIKAHLGRDNSITGHAITFITPDSERTFATHLGAALNFNKNDIQTEDIKNSKIIHLEGYLFEPPALRDACMHALEIAKQNEVLISIDLSDPGLIARIHDVFQHLIKNYADIVFANEEEAKAFTGKEKIDALNALNEICEFAVVKLGSQGSLIKTSNKIYNVEVCKTNVINTNGAGDIYASGVLYGIAKGFSPDECGKLGSYASSLVVSQVGARYTGKIDAEKIIK